MSDGPGNIAQLTAQQQIVTPVTSAQLLALNTTPLVLVPAQGVGTAIIVDEIIYDYTFVSAAYTTGSAGGIFYGAPTSSAYIAGAWDDQLSLLTSSGIFFAPTNAAPATGKIVRTIVENQPIVYGAPSFGTYSAYVGGDGTMTVTVVYRVLTL